MCDLDEYAKQKKAMGKRFKQFRELVEKSKIQMEQEANHPLIKAKKINQFEYGAIIPDIIFIQYFTEEYGLNLTWLVTGSGFIFVKKGPKTPEDIYRLFLDMKPTTHLINEIIGLNQNKRSQISCVNNQLKGGTMGSFNPNPGPEINPELKQQQTIFQELNPGEKPGILTLINSVHYLCALCGLCG